MSTSRFLIRCYGGALNGRDFTWHADTERFTRAGFSYEATGVRVGDHWIFVPVARTERERREIRAALAAGQTDPRLLERRVPLRNRTHRGAAV